MLPPAMGAKGKKGKESAGLLLFRRIGGTLEILLAHPGGPYWARRDPGAWTIPKGQVEPGEETLDCARREFAEETGFEPSGPFVPLGSIRQRSGKVVHAWAAEEDWDPATLRSNAFEVEWPPRSGRMQPFPEIDRAAWFTPAEGRRRILPAQEPLIDALLAHLEAPREEA